MKWEDFYKKFGMCPLIAPQMIYAFGMNWRSQQVQISRWVKQGKLIKLAEGKYVFSEPYRKTPVSHIFIANHLVYPSYVSLEYALSYYDLIPEAVFSVTSLTTRRPITYETELGGFIYRHIKTELFWGYESTDHPEFNAMIATPEKALLDLFYFWRGKITKDRMKEMRFQNLESIKKDRLLEFTKKTGSQKLSYIINDLFLPFMEEDK